jgi:hypothetical protein
MEMDEGGRLFGVLERMDGKIREVWFNEREVGGGES